MRIDGQDVHAGQVVVQHLRHRRDAVNGLIGIDGRDLRANSGNELQRIGARGLHDDSEIGARCRDMAT